MIKKLAKSIREYKWVSIVTPLLVALEVVLECIIPFIIANLVNSIKNGADFSTVIKYGVVLIIMAALSLTFGTIAGFTSATASCGLG